MSRFNVDTRTRNRRLFISLTRDAAPVQSVDVLDVAHGNTPTLCSEVKLSCYDLTGTIAMA